MIKKKSTKTVENEIDFYNTSHYEESDVGSGAWVLITRTIPVSKEIAPQVYGIYWATPAQDSFGRQKVQVYTSEMVCLLNYEYAVLSNERLQEYKEAGWTLQEASAPPNTGLNIKLIEKGRALCSEERDIIDALMLDGLTEQQACEEYYYTHHTNNEHMGTCFLPSPQMREEIENIFGKR